MLKTRRTWVENNRDVINEHSRNWRERKRLASECMQCGKAKPSVRQGEHKCEDCWFSDIAKSTTGTRKNRDMVKNLFLSQGGRCAYTDEVLVAGQNASLDHKIPVSRGGDGSLSNLQWVTIKTNSMKSDLTHKEFVALCTLISMCPSDAKIGEPIPCLV